MVDGSTRDHAAAAGVASAEGACPVAAVGSVAVAGDRWALALLPVAFGVVLVALAIVLARHRDLGAGLLPQRQGAAEAPPLLAGPTAKDLCPPD